MNKKIYFALIGLASLLVSCESFSDALETKEITPISITIRSKITLSGFDNTNGLKLILNNYVEGIRVEKELTSSTIEIGNLIPGMYSIVISGKLKNKEGVSYYLNGSLVNHPILNNRATIDLPISGQKISPLIFKEIFYSGTANFYFRNQFYEIYNNSEELHYLDGIYFAVLYPTKSTSTLPVWPQEDGDKYVYTERIWKFPGNGTTYPLKPGESCVISQFAANHKLDIYNPNSPVDCFSSEFEFNMNNPKFPDQPALDMEHVYFNGKADKGRAPQYLTSVFGGAYVIFKVPEGETYDPVNNPALQTKDQSSSSKMLYAKIPIEYVLDGVEAVDDETKVNAKRMPGVLDAGITTVGATYNSLGVARKKIGENPDGTPFLQDTNNSTEDFERGVVPMFRRYNAKMPSWNHTLK
ncbi:DUF4876 domain-containing protein [Tannerella forsythia]|uniref:DUF4876 domain-containing protein n=1 Tax=Tannerella forsythia TaxID=28112 RepID=A0A3P1YZE5_TANFO|nr:DUF4876 domain-containing protein [Tannerella forsythia]RRD75206.1 DUF4876 domain-containing protein [Tannerella forsythia]